MSLVFNSATYLTIPPMVFILHNPTPGTSGRGRHVARPPRQSRSTHGTASWARATPQSRGRQMRLIQPYRAVVFDILSFIWIHPVRTCKAVRAACSRLSVFLFRADVEGVCARSSPFPCRSVLRKSPIFDVRSAGARTLKLGHWLKDQKRHLYGCVPPLKRCCNFTLSSRADICRASPRVLRQQITTLFLEFSWQS